MRTAVEQCYGDKDCIIYLFIVRICTLDEESEQKGQMVRGDIVQPYYK